jgi:hypothetical protein
MWYRLTQHDAPLGRPMKNLENTDMKIAQHQQYIAEVEIRTRNNEDSVR